MRVWKISWMEMNEEGFTEYIEKLFLGDDLQTILPLCPKCPELIELLGELENVSTSDQASK